MTRRRSTRRAKRIITAEDVPRDREEAIKWYRKAAKQGHADAQFKLGYMHNHSEGIAGDSKEALRWYRMAAEQGNAKAQHSLGMLYREGFGVRADRDESRKWFTMAEENLRTAAEGGDMDAQNLMGEAHELGGYRDGDYEAAAKWHRMAAEQGHAGSQHTLGVMFLLGRGVPQDEGEATKWCGLAAEQGWFQFAPQVMKEELCGLTPMLKQVLMDVDRQCRAEAKQHANAQNETDGMCGK